MSVLPQPNGPTVYKVRISFHLPKPKVYDVSRESRKKVLLWCKLDERIKDLALAIDSEHSHSNLHRKSVFTCKYMSEPSEGSK
jgi:hypothetical protein